MAIQEPLTLAECDLRDFAFMPNRLREDFSFRFVMDMNFRSMKKSSPSSAASRRIQISDSLKREIASKYGCNKGESKTVECHYCEFTGEIRWIAKSPYHVGYVTFKGMHLDHRIPNSKGGETSVKNLVLACVSCNLDKSDTLVEDWRK